MRYVTNYVEKRMNICAMSINESPIGTWHDQRNGGFSQSNSR